MVEVRRWVLNVSLEELESRMQGKTTRVSVLDKVSVGFQGGVCWDVRGTTVSIETWWSKEVDAGQKLLCCGPCSVERCYKFSMTRLASRESCTTALSFELAESGSSLLIRVIFRIARAVPR